VSRSTEASTAERWQDAASLAPRLVVHGLRRALLGAGPSALGTLRREGLSELHWKVLGDALVRFLRSSGPVLTKLGQILATRADLLPRSVCSRLEALYDAHPPMSRRQLRRTLKRAYPEGAPFAAFDPAPVAVGSVGQVHRASLEDGSRVVVKLIRPGTEAAVRQEMNGLRVFAQLFFALFQGADGAAQRLVSRGLEDLARALEVESNLELEADAVDEFRRRFGRNKRVYVPICYREWSSRDVLVLEELSGRPLSRIRDSDPAARRTASLALRQILAQIFDEGRFHADPHAGNLFLLEDGRLGLVDLGLTGELRLEDRKRITRAARAFLAGDAETAIRTLLEFGSVSPDFDLAAFKRDVTEVLRRRGPNPERQPGRLEELVNDLLLVAARHEIYLPPATTLLIKAVVTIEGVARSLDPEIDVVVTAIPIILQSLTPRFLRWSHWRRSG
jgi:ubiquinone biosynthesis protein